MASKNPNKILPPNAWQQNDGYLKKLLTDPWYKHLANINASVLTSTHDFFNQRQIKPYVFPISTGSISSPMGMGSDSLPVKIRLREQDVYLADSMQFSLEVGTRLDQKGAYYIMPTFRGENVDSRHLNEFVHSEAEIAGGIDDVMNLAEDYVVHVVSDLKENCQPDVLATAGTLEHMDELLNRNEGFKRIHYRDALEELKFLPNALEDVQTDHPVITSIGEKQLLSSYGDFIWLTNMPWSNVPFYQAKDPGTPYSKTADMLAGIGEILGCGQRVNTVEDLKESLDFHQVGLTGYEWYSQMREIMPMQTSGFGMGIERLVLWATNNKDIRNCTLLYRDHNQKFYP